MFNGSANLVLDDKGRLSVPAGYRDDLADLCAGHVVVTASPDKCLAVYPTPAWQTLEKQLMALPNMDPGVRNLQRLIVGQAQRCEISKQGRLSIAPTLREYASLDKDVVFVGMGNKFEVWDAGLWHQTQEVDSAALASVLSNLSI